MIRPSILADKAPLIAVALASGLFGPGEIEVLSGMLDKHFGREETTGIWLTDEEGSDVVGVAYVEPERMTEGTFNLLMIAVHPDHQKQGRGAAILRHVESLLAKQGGRVILVETMGIADFEYVREFYRKSGFREEARIRDYYADGADKVVFWKRLRAV